MTATQWANRTIASGAWKKAEEMPEDVAIYLEGEASITYGSIAAGSATTGDRLAASWDWWQAMSSVSSYPIGVNPWYWT